MHRHAESTSTRIAVVGLGNPQTQYEQTRHNVGFMIVDKLLAEYSGQWTKRKLLYEANVEIEGSSIVLLKPYSGMNISGEPLSYVKDSFSKMILIYDDIDMPHGNIRVKSSGSGHGGHNGVRSIIQHLGNDFDRIKVGIGRPDAGSVLDWVLGNFSPEELTQVKTALYDEVKQKLFALLREAKSGEVP